MLNVPTWRLQRGGRFIPRKMEPNDSEKKRKEMEPPRKPMKVRENLGEEKKKERDFSFSFSFFSLSLSDFFRSFSFFLYFCFLLLLSFSFYINGVNPSDATSLGFLNGKISWL